MGCVFCYNSTPYLHANEVSIIGEFNNFTYNATPLIKIKNNWFVELNLPKGEYAYKYVINGELKLNDATAGYYLPDEEGEIWSIAVIGNNKERLEIDSNLQIELFRHVITNRTSDNIDEVRFKSSFNINIDANVVACFEFGNIIGLHSITAVWMTTLHEVFHICEHSVEVAEGDINNIANVWFWISIQDKQREYPNGIWSIKLFVDGEFFMEDQFNLGSGGTYSVTNKGFKVNNYYNGSDY